MNVNWIQQKKKEKRRKEFFSPNLNPQKNQAHYFEFDHLVTFLECLFFLLLS